MNSIPACYNILDILQIRLNDLANSRGLRNLLAPYRMREGCGKFVEMTLCSKKWQFPGLPKQGSSTYKGIPWKAAMDWDGIGQVKRIFFYAPFFVSFLASRILLIPLLKRTLIEKGGFSILGDLFHHCGRTFLVFGPPGSGKTRLNLQALEKGAMFIADNELLVFQDGVIRALFREIELRYRTAKGTLFWNRLSAAERFRLFLFQIISILSLRTISFNISLNPAKLGIESSYESSKRKLTVICLTEQPGMKRLAPESLVEAIIGYENWYHLVFGNVFSVDPKKEEDQIRQNMMSFFSDRPIWRLHAEVNIERILTLS